MTQVTVCTTLYDVDLKIDLEEVLNEVDNDDIVEYLKDHNYTDELVDVVIEKHSDEVIEKLRDGMGVADLVSEVLNGASQEDIDAVAKQFNELAPPLPPKFEFLASHDLADDVVRAAVDGTVCCLVADKTVIMRHGTFIARDADAAREFARFYSLGTVAAKQHDDDSTARAVAAA